MNRALLQQAIDTISYYAAVCGEDDQDTPAKQTIEALKAELAKPEPVPVAWIEHHKAGDNLNWQQCEATDTPLFTKEQL